MHSQNWVNQSSLSLHNGWLRYLHGLKNMQNILISNNMLLSHFAKLSILHCFVTTWWLLWIKRFQIYIDILDKSASMSVNFLTNVICGFCLPTTPKSCLLNCYLRQVKWWVEQNLVAWILCIVFIHSGVCSYIFAGCVCVFMYWYLCICVLMYLCICVLV